MVEEEKMKRPQIKLPDNWKEDIRTIIREELEWSRVTVLDAEKLRLSAEPERPESGAIAYVAFPERIATGDAKPNTLL